MIVEVLCVCRRPPAWVTAATADYGKRLPRNLDLRFRYLAPGHDGVSSTARKHDEAVRVRKAVTSASHVVAVDERGTEYSSSAFAERVADWRARTAHVSLIIGGADGLDAALLVEAAERWSLSQLTLPHLLVQVVLAEQIYRACSILDGHPYHRA